MLEYRRLDEFAYSVNRECEQMVEDFHSHYPKGFDSKHGLLIENLLPGEREYFERSHGQDLQ